MKRTLLILLITVFSITSYSQISFEKGYFINNNGQKINCEIKNLDWRSTPDRFEYRVDADAPIQQISVADVSELVIENVSKFVRYQVDIDRSGGEVVGASADKNPVFTSERLFLKVLLEGKANLYEYTGGDLKRFFYSLNRAQAPTQLVYKHYSVGLNSVASNNYFRQQLWNEFKCPSIALSDVEKVDYKRNDLINFFEKYNKCSNSESVTFEKHQKGDVFNLTPRAHLTNASLSISNSVSDDRSPDFGSKTLFGFGLEAEFVLPFNRNKWSVIVEPVYHNFKADVSEHSSTVSGGVLNSSIDYKSLEVAVGGRYYFFLNPKSKIFVNAAYLIELNKSSSIEFTRADGSELSSLGISPANNFAFGVGFKYNNRYSLEFRQMSSRELLSAYKYYNAGYNSTSVVLGYTVF